MLVFGTERSFVMVTGGGVIAAGILSYFYEVVATMMLSNPKDVRNVDS